ncbi:MAG: hypothetical protein ACYC9S_08955 [Leptospirales bacterium]
MSSSRLLDLVAKKQDSYILNDRVSKEKFAELCAVLGKHGYRYAGKGVFKEESSKTGTFQDPKWWQQHVKSGDWVKLTIDFFPRTFLSEVLRIEDDRITIIGEIQLEPMLTIFYGHIREVLEVRRAAENALGPLRKIPTRPRRP